MSNIGMYQKILNGGVICAENIEKLMNRVNNYNDGKTEIEPAEIKKCGYQRRYNSNKNRWTADELALLKVGKFIETRNKRSCINRLHYESKKGNLTTEKRLLILAKIGDSYANKCY